MGPPPDACTVERVRAGAGEHLLAAADEVVQLPWGFALRTPSLPLWYDLNMVVLQRADPALDAARVADVVDEALPGLPRVAVELWPPIAPELLPAGWEPDRFALLAHTGPRPAPPAGVTEVARERVVGLRLEWLGATAPPEVLPQAAAAEARMFTRTPTRAFAVLEGDVPVASALLVGDGPVRMVEDVYTTPRCRGRGYGAAVVRAALAAGDAAGAEVLWLATDAAGRALALYERLGFRRAITVARASRVRD